MILRLSIARLASGEGDNEVRAPLLFGGVERIPTTSGVRERLRPAPSRSRAARFWADVIASE